MAMMFYLPAEQLINEMCNWTNLIDRGSLKNINNRVTGIIMHVIVMYVQKVFCKEGIQKKSNHLKHQLIDIVNDDDVLFHWSMLAINLDASYDC